MNSKIGLKILIAVLVIAFGIGVIFFIKNSIPKIEYEIIVSQETLIKNTNDQFNVVDECGIYIKNATEDKLPYFTITDENIASIDQLTGNVTCKNEGNCKIYIHFRVDDNTTLLKYINLSVGSGIVYATDVSIEKTKVEMTSVNPDPDYYETNILNLNGCTITPIITYQNNLVTYDYITGKIYINPNVDSGDDIVIIQLEKQDGSYIELSFQVEITGQVLELNQKTLSVNINLNKSTPLPPYDAYLGAYIDPEISISNSNVEIDLENSGYNYIAVIGKNLGTTQIILETSNFKLIYEIIIEE